MKQSLVTRKNRKLREVRRLYPDVNVKLFYRRDIERLAQRYRLEITLLREDLRRRPPARPRGQPIGGVYLGRDEIAARVPPSSAPRSRRRTPGRVPLLVAPLKSSAVFLADLSRALPLAHELDVIELAPYRRPPRRRAPPQVSTSLSRGATCSSSRTSSTPDSHSSS